MPLRGKAAGAVVAAVVGSGDSRFITGQNPRVTGGY